MDKQFVIKPSDNEKDMRRATTGPNTPMSEHEARAQLSARRSVVADHRTNNGFGGNNLEHLGHVARFLPAFNSLAGLPLVRLANGWPCRADVVVA